MYTLVIGNRNYSSWSLRAWLHLRASNIPFEEVRIPLRIDGWQEAIRQYSPAGLVPVLVDDGFPVWDSLAIIEYICERHPQAVAWPEDPVRRARARSITAEMHSGFMSIRDELPQNIRARKSCALSDLSESCRREVDRVADIWSSCRTEFANDGDWLFGDLSIADIMFAPVALRFVTYSISIPSPGSQFVEAIECFAPVQEWIESSKAETETISTVDLLRE